MSLELIRESIKVGKAIGREAAQTVVENDIIVPDSKPDVSRILLLDGDIRITSTEVVEGEVLVNGVIHYNILYLADDDEKSVKSINTGSNFAYSLDMPGAKQGMKARVKCDVEHIEHEILHGRKIGVKAVIAADGKITSEQERFFISDIRGTDDVQVLRGSMKINCNLGSSKGEYTVRELVDVPSGKPPIREILRNDVKITGKEYKISDGRVIARGDLNVATLYIADDETQSLQFMEHEIPFSQFVDLPGVEEGALCEVDYQIDETRFEPAEDSDGEFRSVDNEINIKLDVSGYIKKDIEAIVDAYSPLTNLKLERDIINMESFTADTKAQVSLKDVLVVDADKPQIAQVFNVISKPFLTESRAIDGKVVIEGVVRNSILYLTNDDEQPVACFQQEIPLRHVVDVTEAVEDMDCDVELDVVHCNYSMNTSNEVEVRLGVGVNVRLMDKMEEALVEKINELPMQLRSVDDQPSITIYFSRSGDKLWEVAKKYLTTMDDIRKFNKLEDESDISPGQKILIPRRKD